MWCSHCQLKSNLEACRHLVHLKLGKRWREKELYCYWKWGIQRDTKKPSFKYLKTRNNISTLTKFSSLKEELCGSVQRWEKELGKRWWWWKRKKIRTWKYAGKGMKWQVRVNTNLSIGPWEPRPFQRFRTVLFKGKTFSLTPSFIVWNMLYFVSK